MSLIKPAKSFSFGDTSEYLVSDEIANLLSNLSRMLGLAIPRHRFLISTQVANPQSISSLDLKIKEVWLTLFPNGEAIFLKNIPDRSLFPVLWIGEKTNEVRLLKGVLSDGSFVFENTEGKDLKVKSEDLEHGRVIILKSDVKINDQKNKNFSAEDWFFYAIKKRKGFFLEAIAGSTVVNILTLAVSFYSMQVYDRVIPTESYSTLIVITLGVLIALILEFITKELRGKILEKACKFIDTELSGVFFGRMLSIRMDARPRTIGTFAAQIKQFEFVRNFMTSSTLFILADLPFVLFFIFVIWIVGGIVALVPLMLLPISIASGFIAKWKLRHIAEEQLLEANQKNGLLVEAIDGIEAIKAVGGEWKMLEVWKSLTSKSAEKELTIRNVTSAATNLTQTIQQLSYIMMIMVGAYAIGSGKLTSGALIACTIISNRALSPIAQISGRIIQWHHAKSALKGLDEMMQMEVDYDEDHRMVVPDVCHGKLRLEDAQFTYNKGEKPAIDGMSLNINPSEKIAIIGSIGSGKSTLIKVLSALYKPHKGKVFLDDVDMHLISPNFLRESIGYLTQDVRLFNGSLRYNLTLGLPTPTDSLILEACTKTGLINIIKNHPKGLELPIYEGGRGLSGGQRQLVGLTRMLIAKPKILLLDEPTASMDNELELKVMQKVFTEADPYAVIILSTHKLALLNFVNRIIVVDKSRIVMDGPRDEVIAKLKDLSTKAQKV